MPHPRPQPNQILASNHPEGSTASYPALRMEQNNQRFYFTTIPKADIFPFCYVADRNEDPVKGFQRVLDINRAKDISKYLDESRGSIPTNVVLSAQPEAELRYDGKTKTLKFKRLPKSFLVLDGQHRLYGYGLTQKDHRVPVSIYEGLGKQEEVALFIDINTTQRGVPAALLLDIKQLAQRENAEEAQLREMFDALGSQTDSPLHGLMSASQSAHGRIARPTFNKAVQPLLRIPIMEQLPREKRFELFKNYLRALDQTLATPKLLRVAAFFESFCSVFDEVLRLSRERYSNYKLDSLSKVLQPLNNIDLSHVSAGGRARLSRTTIAPILKDLIIGQVNVDPNMV
ncbi:MAG: DGQHR domain-containing protein [Verrucomicrobiota bacterium]